MSEWKNITDLKNIFLNHAKEFQAECVDNGPSFNLAEALAFICQQIEELKKHD